MTRTSAAAVYVVRRIRPVAEAAPVEAPVVEAPPAPLRWDARRLRGEVASEFRQYGEVNATDPGSTYCRREVR